MYCSSVGVLVPVVFLLKTAAKVGERKVTPEEPFTDLGGCLRRKLTRVDG